MGNIETHNMSFVIFNKFIIKCNEMMSPVPNGDSLRLGVLLGTNNGGKNSNYRELNVTDGNGSGTDTSIHRTYFLLCNN